MTSAEKFSVRPLVKKKSTNQRIQYHPSNVQTDRCNCMILLYFRKYHHQEYIYCHVQHTRQYLEMTARHWQCDCLVRFLRQMVNKIFYE